MTLHLTAKTAIPDLYIDYIEVQLKSGSLVSLNWDESNIVRSSFGFWARYQNVCFGEEYANGKLAELTDMVITAIGVYSESDHEPDLSIETMNFEDDDLHILFINPKVIGDGLVFTG